MVGGIGAVVGSVGSSRAEVGVAVTVTVAVAVLADNGVSGLVLSVVMVADGRGEVVLGLHVGVGKNIMILISLITVLGWKEPDVL